MANTCGNLASVYSPYLWPDADAPRFLKAMLASIFFSLAVICVAIFMRWSLRKQNKKLREENPNALSFFVH